MPGVQHKVVMVAHQATRQQLRVRPRQPLRHHCKQPFTVSVVKEYVLAPVPSRTHVTQRTGECEVGGTRGNLSNYAKQGFIFET